MQDNPLFPSSPPTDRMFCCSCRSSILAFWLVNWEMVPDWGIMSLPPLPTGGIMLEHSAPPVCRGVRAGVNTIKYYTILNINKDNQIFISWLKNRSIKRKAFEVCVLLIPCGITRVCITLCQRPTLIWISSQGGKAMPSALMHHCLAMLVFFCYSFWKNWDNLVSLCSAYIYG